MALSHSRYGSVQQGFHILFDQRAAACSGSNLLALPLQGRAYNLYDPSLGQTMNSALIATIYGSLITPNISHTPGVVRFPV